MLMTISLKMSPLSEVGSDREWEGQLTQGIEVPAALNVLPYASYTTARNLHSPLSPKH